MFIGITHLYTWLMLTVQKKELGLMNGEDTSV